MPEVALNLSPASPINVSIVGASPSNTTITAGSVVNVTVTNTGDRGPTGPQGPPATTIDVGKVTTLSPGASATVTATSSNDGANLTLNFGLPAGATGATGPAGQNGATPQILIGTVSTLEAGSTATVSATTVGTKVSLDFGIPRGDAGADGAGGTTVALSNANPANLGAATPGTSTLASRADHRHNLPVISYTNLTNVPGNFPTNIASVSGLAGNYVERVNNLTGNLTLAAGSNVTITPSGSTLTIAASGGGIAWANVPPCPTSNGVAGQIAHGTDGYLYVCTQTNTWVRTLLTSWACVPQASNVQFFDSTNTGTVVGDSNSSIWWDLTVPGSPSQVQIWLIGPGGAGNATEAGGGGAVIWTSRAYTGQAIKYRIRVENFYGMQLWATEVKIGNELWSAGGGAIAGVTGGGGYASGTTTNSQFHDGTFGTVSSGVFWGGAAGANGYSATPAGCRMVMPDLDNIRTALGLVPKKAVEDCGTAPAAGSGGYYSPAYGGSVVNLAPGYGGGGAYNQEGGSGAILFVFS